MVNNMYFDTFFIIGSGKIAFDCSNILLGLGVSHFIIDSRPKLVSTIEFQHKQEGVTLLEWDKRKSIESQIINNALGMTLVISANNEHVFEKDVFLDNIKIINFHYGLLPDYRGMNIPSWIIYNEEVFSGVTWHYVNEKIDDGRIIAQRKFDIDKWDTAFLITKRVMIYGGELFKEFIEDFLNGPQIGYINDFNKCEHRYCRNDVPNNGVISEKDSGSVISKCLRAYDYGLYEYIPKLKFKKRENLYTVLKYRIYKCNELKIGKNNWQANYTITCDEYKFDLLLSEKVV